MWRYIRPCNQLVRFFALDPDLYEDAMPEFNEKGMANVSKSGALYDLVGIFAYFWGWTEREVLTMPVRKRKKYTNVLDWQIKNFGPKNNLGLT